MKSSELRLGNLVSTHMGIGTIQQLRENYARVCVQGDNQVSRILDYDRLDGIPLTDSHFEGVNGITVKWSLKGRAEISMCGIPITVISHLHEWQNLYYLLLGSEMEVSYLRFGS